MRIRREEQKAGEIVRKSMKITKKEQTAQTNQKLIKKQICKQLKKLYKLRNQK